MRRRTDKYRRKKNKLFLVCVHACVLIHTQAGTLNTTALLIDPHRLMNMGLHAQGENKEGTKE